MSGAQDQFRNIDLAGIHKASTSDLLWLHRWLAYKNRKEFGRGFTCGISQLIIEEMQKRGVYARNRRSA